MRVFLGLAYCYFEYHKEAKQSLFAIAYSDMSLGTIFAISHNGLALTASHTLKDREATTVEGQFIQVLDYEGENDLALLQLPRHREYTYLKLGNSDELKPGDEVYHFGLVFNKFMGCKGYYQGRDDKWMFTNIEMIHGQSGGPLLNKAGEVVGINSGHFGCNMTRMRENPGHGGPSRYVPINKARYFLEQRCVLTDKGWVMKSK